jgi:hypothetical protein
MSLLQEMEKHGLADCEFNRNLTKKKYRAIATYTVTLELVIEAVDDTEAWNIAYEADGGDFKEIGEQDWQIENVSEIKRG